MERQYMAESTINMVTKVKNSSKVDRIVAWIKSNRFLLFILASVIFGVSLGEFNAGTYL